MISISETKMSDPNLFNSSLVETLIFELILAGKKDVGYEFDFPTVQVDAVESIANNLSNFIYESLKQKSSASSIRRANLLKFINIICEEKEAHLASDNYLCILESVKDIFKPNSNDDLEIFFTNSSNEVESLYLNDFTHTVLEFNKRKNMVQKEKAKVLETIKKYDQENMNSKLNIQIQKHFSCFETSENFVIDLLGAKLNANCTTNCVTIEYREKQIKLCYALINLNQISYFHILKSILYNLSTYECLRKFEVNFLKYLWLLEGDEFSDLCELVVDKFYFVVEKCIIKFCMEILTLNDEREVCQYFVNLEDDKQLKKIRKFSLDSSSFYRKTRSLIYELYVMSFCNANVLQFINLIL